MFMILYFVFTKFLKVGTGIPHYPVYLLLGIVLWNYFTEVSMGGVTAVVSKGDLMRKINFPRYVVVLAGSFSALINLSLNFVVIAVFMYFGHVTFGIRSLLVLPVIVELFIFSLAVAFFLSALFVRFRDVSYIWEVAVQAGFYLTPILYALSRIPSRYAKILILSPLSQIIQDSRRILVTNQTTTIYSLYKGNYYIWLIPLGVTLCAAIFGAFYFRNRSKLFAEES
jgi:ABC-2 type transport system permease protein